MAVQRDETKETDRRNKEFENGCVRHVTNGNDAMFIEVSHYENSRQKRNSA